MPSSPYVIRLSAGERAELESLSRRAAAPHRAVLRARIVLLADGDVSNAEIARRLGTCEDTARKWRCRYCRKGAEGLADLPRPGRPRVFPAAVVTQVKALACELPAASETPLARWTCPELARKASASGIAPAPSPSTVRRWLAADALKPWQHRSWIFPRDPHFALRAGRVLDLYQREWEGQALGDDEYVISADEKPGIQARMRIHLPLPAGPGRAARIEAEYRRHGTIAYLAAYDVHQAQVTGRCEETTGIRPFTALAGQVMATEPYASAKRVFWVVDNGASHRNWAAAARMSDAYPNAHMVHLPVHASWLNQVEVCFSVLQRKALVPDDFEDLDEAAVLAFEKHYNAVARPFDWRFTRASLNQLLARVQKHDSRRVEAEAPAHVGDEQAVAVAGEPERRCDERDPRDRCASGLHRAAPGGVIKGTARTGVACGAITQAAYPKSARTIVGKALDDPLQEALEVTLFGRREVLEQWRYRPGS